MKSGGAITFDPAKIIDGPDRGKVAGDADIEIRQGLSNPRAIVNDDTLIEYDGLTYKWKELKEAVSEAVQAKPGANVDPTEFKKALQSSLLKKLTDKATEVDKLKQELANAKRSLSQTPQDVAKQQTVREAEARLRTAQAELQTMVQAAKNAGIAANNSVLARATQASQGETPSTEQHNTNTGGAFGEARASYTASGSGPSGGQQAGGPQGGARAMGVGGNGYGGGYFDGVAPLSSAAYARALYMDGTIADGLASISQRSREGQRLMMLFLYYAKMAESGDLGAMYQFMRFITYIISKDKAKQNIQISSKLIQLQDLSRKSTEALLAQDGKDQTEFTKALHKAKSEESTIATSQKLLADMLQEFAHVTETLTNSVKNVLDAWGRVQRTASSR